jgi:hypothetical protein
MPSTITLCGPAFGTGIDHLRRTYSNLNFSHTYLYDSKADSCNSFSDEYQNMIARWLYKTMDSNSLPVIVSSCKMTCTLLLGDFIFEETQFSACINPPNLFNQLASEWNVLVITTYEEIERGKIFVALHFLNFKVSH